MHCIQALQPRCLPTCQLRYLFLNQQSNLQEAHPNAKDDMNTFQKPETKSRQPKSPQIRPPEFGAEIHSDPMAPRFRRLPLLGLVLYLSPLAQVPQLPSLPLRQDGTQLLGRQKLQDGMETWRWVTLGQIGINFYGFSFEDLFIYGNVAQDCHQFLEYLCVSSFDAGLMH